MPNNMLLSACVRATLFKENIAKRVIKGIAAVAAFSPVLALADGSDLAGMVTSAATGSTTVTKGSLNIAQMLGVLFVIGAVIAAKTKKDNPQIKVSHIAASAVFGACLIAIPEIIKRTQSQVGLTPISVG